ncbi:MAG TPA: ATP-binding protein [Solirubrobacteraceae bacterium]|nr:ATP-binding protein [Solirubrobacteraceae bacterium]
MTKLEGDTTTDDHSYTPGGFGPWGRLTLGDDVTLPYLGDAQFAALVFAREIAHTADVRWSTAAISLDPILPHALTTVRTAGMRSVLADLGTMFAEGAVALVTLGRGSVHARIAAREQALLGDIEAWLRQTFPVLEPSDRPELPVRFWTCGPHGASSMTRMIDVPSFEAIKDNYPVAVREHLATLASSDHSLPRSGQLLLWYGPPGTGKTYALRALGWEWRHWCDVHYVIDPEVFFGQRADYMVDVLLEDDKRFDLDELGQDENAKWRLLVLEDTGELLAADAKERTGQGLSRLLNLVDGIVGQGLRLLVLVTTNEPLRRLHPAVARPGRCAAQVEFARFSPSEARGWLSAHGGDDPQSKSATLAELFARLSGEEVERHRGVGFAADV